MYFFPPAILSYSGAGTEKAYVLEFDQGVIITVIHRECRLGKEDVKTGG